MVVVVMRHHPSMRVVHIGSSFMFKTLMSVPGLCARINFLKRKSVSLSLSLSRSLSLCVCVCIYISFWQTWKLIFLFLFYIEPRWWWQVEWQDGEKEGKREKEKMQRDPWLIRASLFAQPEMQETESLPCHRPDRSEKEIGLMTHEHTLSLSLSVSSCQHLPPIHFLVQFQLNRSQFCFSLSHVLKYKACPRPL